MKDADRQLYTNIILVCMCVLKNKFLNAFMEIFYIKLSIPCVFL